MTKLDYDATHAVAFPSKLLAQNGGKHIYNVKLTTACDNGNLIARDAFINLDSYTEKAATTFTGVVQRQAANGNWYVEVTNPGDALFVYTQPWNAEEWTNTFKDEKRWYNEKDEYVRAYELAVGDVFEVSEEGFTSKPSKGAAVTGVTAKKLAI